MSSQWAKPPRGAEPRFELEPALQQSQRTTNWATLHAVKQWFFCDDNDWVVCAGAGFLPGVLEQGARRHVHSISRQSQVRTWYVEGSIQSAR